MRRIVFHIISIYLLAVGGGYAQGEKLPALTFKPQEATDTFFTLEGHIEIFVDTACNTSFREVKEKPFSPFHSFPARHNGIHPPWWYHLKIQPAQPTEEKWFLDIGWHDVVDVYTIQGEEVSHRRTGQVLPWQSRSLKREDMYNIPLDLSEGEPLELYIRASYLTHRHFPPVPYLFSVQRMAAWEMSGFAEEGIEIMHYDSFFHVSMLVLNLFMALFILLQYFIARKKAYLFYALHLTVYFLYHLEFFEMGTSPNILFSFLGYSTFWWGETALFLLLVFYFKFLQHFLSLPEQLPRLNAVIRNTAYFLLAAWGLSTLGYLFFLDWMFYNHIGNGLQGLLLVVMVFCLYVLWRIYQAKLRLSRFVLLGSGALFASVLLMAVLLLNAEGSVGSLFRSFLHSSLSYGANHPSHFLTVGFLFEMLFFGMGLGYKSYLDQKEKVEAQEALLSTAKLQKKVAEAELKALRAQMNPHFIFNALNSIKNLIQQQENEDAIHYLTQFARLIRAALTLSEKQQSSLEEELDFCHLYLEMEKLRFQDSFHYEIDVEESIDLSYLKVPPMILQPFLENAIWHGLLPRDGRRWLKVQLDKEPDGIRCIIEDNGIGRELALANRRMNGRQREALGIQLVRGRLKINRDLFKQDYDLRIIDKYDGDIPAGTRVEISLNYD